MIGSSRSLDTASAGSAFNSSNAFDALNSKINRGASDFDVRNTFTGYFDYAIPAFRGPTRLTHGWEVNSGFSFHGGTFSSSSARFSPPGVEG